MMKNRLTYGSVRKCLAIGRKILFILTISLLALFTQTINAATALTDSFVLKIPIDFYYHLPILQAKINGQSFNLLFDLGASYAGLSLNKKSEKLLHSSFTGKSLELEDSLAQKSKFEEIMTPSIHIGDVMFGDVKGVQYHLWGSLPYFSIPDIDGAMGLDFFEKYTDYVVLNYKEGYITLIKGQVPDIDLNGFAKMSYFKDDTIIKNLMKLNNARMTVAWDTGAAVSVINGNNKVVRFSRHFDIKILTQDIEYVETVFALPTGQELGAYKFYLYNIPSVFHIDAIVGYNYFYNNIIVIDFKHREIYVKAQ